jgi:hypothetical protein
VIVISSIEGPRQSADAVAAAIAATIEHLRPEGYPYRNRLVLLNAIATGFCDRVAQKWGRTPVAR